MGKLTITYIFYKFLLYVQVYINIAGISTIIFYTQISLLQIANMKVPLKLLCVLLLTDLLTSVLCEQSYVVTNEELQFFDGEQTKLVDFSGLGTVKRERFINGSVTFFEDMDDDVKFQVELFNSPSGDGDYQQMPMGVPPTGVCEGFKKFYVQFVQHSLITGETTDMPFVPDDGLCPFPAGKYYVKDILLNTEAWPSQVPRGIVKCVITFLKDDVQVGGFVVVIKIEDRTS